MKSPRLKPKDQLNFRDGELDLSRPDSINQQGLIKIPKSASLRPKDHLAIVGDMDFVTDKDHEVVQAPPRSPRPRPSNHLTLEGDMDLSRNDNDIHHLRPVVSCRRRKITPEDHLGLEGDLDLDRSDNINHQKPSALNLRRASSSRQNDYNILEGEMDWPRSTSMTSSPRPVVKSAKPIDNLIIRHGDLDLSARRDSIHHQRSGSATSDTKGISPFIHIASIVHSRER